MSLNGLLSMAASALLRNQVALSVTGHNVSNVHTEGYSRQRVTMVTEAPSDSRAGQIGNGVNIDSILRQVDEFLIREVNGSVQDLSRWEEQNAIMAQVETVLTESEDFGINKLMNDFWNAWSDLANEPSGLTERTALLNTAESLADAFQSRAEALEEINQGIDNEISVAVDEINSITTQIADLDKQISLAEAGNAMSANDLRDKREKLVDELGGYLDVEYLESTGPDGQLEFHVYLSDGRSLVDGGTSYNLNADSFLPDSQYHDVQLEGSSATSGSILADVTKGKLAAWIEVRDEHIPEILSQLDQLAANLAVEVNKLHIQGYGLDGSSGNRFFETLPVSTWGNNENQGDVMIEGGVMDLTQLTMDAYRIEFTSPTEFRVINETTGEPLANPDGAVDDYTWDYTSGAPIRFDGLEINITDGDTTPQAGDVFYVDPAKNAAKHLSPASEVLADTDKIAAGEVPEAGDNGMAIMIQELQTTTIMKDGTVTFEMYYGSTVSLVGVLKQEAELNEDHYTAVHEQLNTLKLSTSGVSLDEEMTFLMKYQYAFQASSKLVTTTDELYQVLLGMLNR